MERPRRPDAADDIIRSRDNRLIKLIRSLGQRKGRETERAFVVEGFRAIADAIAAGARPTTILVREGVSHETWLGSEIDPRIVEQRLFDGLSETVTPQGAIAVFPLPELPIEVVQNPLFLILDQIRDPGNLGTLIRTAASAGATALFLTEGSVDPFNGKAVRAAVGAHFRLPLRWLTEEYFDIITHRCPLRALADASATQTHDELDWTDGAAVVIGSEAHGLSDWVKAIATTSVRIPLAAGVESLNAAAAGAVILFEAARQRRIAVEHKST